MHNNVQIITFVNSTVWTSLFLLPAYIICCSGLQPGTREKWKYWAIMFYKARHAAEMQMQSEKWTKMSYSEKLNHRLLWASWNYHFYSGYHKKCLAPHKRKNPLAEYIAHILAFYCDSDKMKCSIKNTADLQSECICNINDFRTSQSKNRKSRSQWGDSYQQDLKRWSREDRTPVRHRAHTYNCRPQMYLRLRTKRATRRKKHESVYWNCTLNQGNCQITKAAACDELWVFCRSDVQC